MQAQNGRDEKSRPAGLHKSELSVLLSILSRKILDSFFFRNCQYFLNLKVLRKMEVEQTRNHIFPSFTNLAITNRIKRNHQAGLDLRFNP